MTTLLNSPAARAFVLPGGVYNATPNRIVFGAGTAASIAQEVQRLGCSKALVLSTPGRAKMAAKVVEDLDTLCAGLLPEAVSQVPVELAERGREKARAMGADCLVSIGGGASIGLGKGISLGLNLPIIAIPTTYSGSEMTGFCGITIDGVKQMHTSLSMLATTVIYDPTLSLGLPIDASMSSAMNALAHCVDGIYVSTISEAHRLVAAEGAAIVARATRAVLADPSDLQARTELLYGGHLAGATLSGGFALQHGLAHTLGGSFGVPHGLAHALSLPYVTAFNTRFAPKDVALIGRAMGVENVAGAIHDLLVALGLPVRLSDAGIKDSDIDRIVTITVETDNGLNPAPVTAETVRAVVLAAFEGARPA